MTTSNQDPGRPTPGAMPGSAATGTSTKTSTKATTGATTAASKASSKESPKDKIKQDAKDVKREATSRAREQAEAGQHKVAGEVDALSDAIDAAASNLDDHDREGLARYARQLSTNLASAAGQLEDRSVDELAKDAKRLARDNPALFMLGSIAVGFGLSRFFKSSAEHDHQDSDNAARTDAYRTDANFDEDDDASTIPPVRRREPGMPATYAASSASGSSDGREMS